MPAENLTETEKWWNRFKFFINASPSDVAQFIADNPGAAKVLLSKKRRGVFSQRNFREEILNDPNARRILSRAEDADGRFLVDGHFLNAADDADANDNLRQHVDNVGNLTNLSISKIGRHHDNYDEFAPFPFVEDLVEVFKKVEEKVELTLHKQGQEGQNVSDNERRVIRLGGDCYYFVQNDLPMGVSQHKELPWLYSSLSPEFAEENKITSEQTHLEVTAESYLEETAKKLSEKHPMRKKQIIFVLGRREEKENYKCYSKLPLEQVQSKEDQRIITSRLQLKKEGLEDVKTEIHYIEADGAEKLNLDTQSLDSLYDAIKECQQGNATLRVHCRQGVDRTGVFVFAAQLLSNFNTVFRGTETEIAENLKRQHMILRESRGPNILKFIPYYQISVKLAIALKAVEQQRRCEERLATVFGAVDAKKVLVELHNKETIDLQIQYLENLIQQQENASNKSNQNLENSNQLQVNASNKSNKIASLQNLLTAVVNRDDAERSFQAANHFVQTYTNIMVDHFLGLMQEGIAKDNDTSKEKVTATEDTGGKRPERYKVIARNLDELKAYWEEKAKAAGFNNDQWYKDAWAKLFNIAEPYLKTKSMLEELQNKANSATLDDTQREKLAEDIKNIDLNSAEELKKAFSEAFPDMHDNKAKFAAYQLGDCFKQLVKMKDDALSTINLEDRKCVDLLIKFFGKENGEATFKDLCVEVNDPKKRLQEVKGLILEESFRKLDSNSRKLDNLSKCLYKTNAKLKFSFLKLLPKFSTKHVSLQQAMDDTKSVLKDIEVFKQALKDFNGEKSIYSAMDIKLEQKREKIASQLGDYQRLINQKLDKRIKKVQVLNTEALMEQSSGKKHKALRRACTKLESLMKAFPEVQILSAAYVNANMSNSEEIKNFNELKKASHKALSQATREVLPYQGEIHKTKLLSRFFNRLGLFRKQDKSKEERPTNTDRNSCKPSGDL